MQEKRQPVLRLPFSYSGPGPSLRGWNACRGGRNDALSPSPDMDRESACGAETLDRMPSVMPFTIPGCCPDGRGLWHGRLGIEPTTRGFGDRIASLRTFAPVLRIQLFAFATASERKTVVSPENREAIQLKKVLIRKSFLR